jgi:oligopeptide transport system permease protein
MWRYLGRRLLFAIPTLAVIATLAFGLLHATPGGPFDTAKRMPPEIKQSIESRYHLDEPLWRQYVRYMGNLAQGDLGPSFQYRNTSVNELIRQGLPVDVTVGCLALGAALLIGGSGGLLAALRRDSAWDTVAMFLATLGISLPVFVVAPLLVLVFAVELHWLPSGDWHGGDLRYVILPVTALSLPYIAYIARMVRGAAIEVLASPYIRTARAKGLPARTVILRHALRPVLTPLVSFLGPAFAGVLTGSIIVETVFGLPGIGRYFLTGALNRDYTLVVGVTVLYGALIIGFNLLADLCYAWIDPRVRL